MLNLLTKNRALLAIYTCRFTKCFMTFWTELGEPQLVLWLRIKCENEKGISRLVVKYYSKIPAIVGVFSCKIFFHYNGSGPLIWINNKGMSGCNFKLNHSHYA